MNDWTTKTLQCGSATIIIHRPVLAEKERAKRENQAQATLGRVMKNYYERNCSK